MIRSKSRFQQMIEALVAGGLLLFGLAAFLLDLKRSGLWGMLLPTPRSERHNWHIMP